MHLRKLVPQPLQWRKANSDQQSPPAGGQAVNLSYNSPLKVTLPFSQNNTLATGPGCDEKPFPHGMSVAQSLSGYGIKLVLSSI